MGIISPSDKKSLRRSAASGDATPSILSMSRREASVPDLMMQSFELSEIHMRFIIDSCQQGPTVGYESTQYLGCSASFPRTFAPEHFA